jgi:predicted AAA+ superfamily ATPase
MDIKELIDLDKEIKNKISKYSQKRDLCNELIIEKPFKLILGLRGVGKTTVLVQHAMDNEGFYINLDEVSLKSINLRHLLDELNQKMGINNFYLDEIQSLENWELQLKNIFEVTDFNLIISGSSLINILEKTIDLSRRIITHEIPPFSFREFLLFKKGITIEKISYNNLFNLIKRNKKLTQIIQYEKYFSEYLTQGAYPFIEQPKQATNTFKNILNKTLYIDFTRIKNTDEETIQLTLKVLKYISSGTEEISQTSLSNVLGVSKSKVISILDLLEKSMLIVKIEPKSLGKNLLKKHVKYSMLLPLRSLVNEIFSIKTEIGNLREDMFVTSLFYQRRSLFYLVGNNKNPDFYFEGSIFEVGGKSKTKKQIKNLENSYLVKDSITFEKREISLILFGFLY